MGIHAGRKRAADLLDLRIRRRCDRTAVASDQHQRCSEDDLAAVDAGAAGAQLLTDHDVGNVLDADRDAGPRRHDDLRDVLDVFDPATGADHVPFAILFDVVGAPADVVGLNRLDDLIEGQSEADQPRRVGLHLELLDETPDGIGAGHTGDRLHLRADDPILHGAQIHRPLKFVGQSLTFGREICPVGLPAGLPILHRAACARLGVFDRPPIDLAKSR